MRFEFATAGRILFGAGALRESGAALRILGARALVVTGRDGTRAAPLLDLLRGVGVGHEVFPVPGEPTLALAEQGQARARAARCDLVIAIGGGSVLDAGKAIAALATNDGGALDYVEVIGRGQPLSNPPLPIVAIPTTAGTGAEVTRNAVLGSPEHRFKVSLRSPLLLPRLAIVDPELTLSLPPALTASTGLDALTQLIEPYVSCRANPLTDALCVEGIRRAARSLRRACDAPTDSAARVDLALASLFSGMALANAGLGAAHGFAAPIGGMFPAPHGAVCAALLPRVMAANCAALANRHPGGEPLRRFDEVARLLTGAPTADAAAGIAWVRALVKDLGIPPLGHWGVRPEHADELVEKAAQASSMKANPLPLAAAELKHILLAAL